MSESVNKTYEPEEIHLLDLLSRIWKGKLIVVGAAFLFGAIFAVVAINTPNMYKSSMLLAAADTGEGGDLSSLANKFGGLASLAGVNLGGAQGTDIALTVEILKSRDFQMQFIDKHQLAVPIFAVSGWDYASDSFLYDSELYDADKQAWVREVEPPKKQEPSLIELRKFMKDEYLKVDFDQNSGLVEVSFSHYSPYFAKETLKKLVAFLNDRTREKDIKEAQKSIDYLNEVIADTRLKDLENVFYELIQQQEQKKMLANTREEYSLRVIDPPIAPEEPAYPNRFGLLLLGLFLGGFIGAVTSVFRYSPKK
ncbi:Chain length determinant protein [Pseudoalteromonas sp. THAF3]|uniref:Wzz/FepE/Etk N-terminal domain-containing protein n=1 Tax=Pseudoalteromonas TaxID=53246 RepID=UPI0012449A14|nr:MULTISPECIES: Wzz/FepE/Etk N-terminal domain-containing protein [Pseudoalteromonas]QFU03781.1 Chain length determinant protein [Pseudoalteromonas sp. THAF3]|tara:strand:- start:33079 stop:34008 length:930 start_codon:yes stop_codon:yes gene_type:complete